MNIVNIARDFSSTPAGRFPEDGPFNGTKFREQFLVPALRGNESVTIELDGVSGFGSSFLEEAFGGLVRVHHMSKDDLDKRLKISYRDPALIYYAESITDFISSAVEE
jgi:hypothetical protein